MLYFVAMNVLGLLYMHMANCGCCHLYNVVYVLPNPGQELATAVRGQKSRGKIYKGKKAQLKRSKERLQQKCAQLRQTCTKAHDDKVELEKQNLHLKR